MLHKALKAVKRALQFKNSTNSENLKKSPAYNKIYEAIKNDKALRIRKELFSDRLMISFDGEEQTELNDYDITEIILRLGNNGFQGSISRRVVEEVIDYIGYLNAYDEPRDWINSLQWDGVERIGSFFANSWGLEDSEYLRFAGEYLWTALAACALGDEISKEIMIVLVGDQGIGKSTFVRKLVPYTKWYTGINFHMSDTETILKTLGCLVAELAELAGLRRKEIEHVKAFLTEFKYRIRRIYKRSYEDVLRRCLYFGTTNDPEFLIDNENRRYLVINLGSKNANLGYLNDYLEQLWAEGKVLYQERGILHKNAEFEAKKHHHKFKVISNEEEKINLWIYRKDFRKNSETGEKETQKTRPIDWDYLLLSEVLQLACNIERPTQKERNNAAQALRELGYENVVKRENNKIIRVWVKK